LRLGAVPKELTQVGGYRGHDVFCWEWSDRPNEPQPQYVYRTHENGSAKGHPGGKRALV